MSLQAPPPVQFNTQPRTTFTQSVTAQPQPQPQASTQRPLSTTTTIVATNNAQAPPAPGSAFQRAKHRVKMLLGYAGPRRAQRDRQEIVRLIVVLAYSFAQMVVILALTIVGAKTTSPLPNDNRNPPTPQSELSACALLGAWNLLWIGKLIIWGCLGIWVLRYKRRARAARRLARRQQLASRADLPPLEFAQGGAHQPDPNGGNAAPVEGEPWVERHELCPLTWTSTRLFLWKSDLLVTVIWFFSMGFISWRHYDGWRCRDAAKNIDNAGFTVLIMVYIQYSLTVLIPTIRMLMARRRASQPTVGKLAKKDVDRIPLVLYIPPPPTDTPASPISPLPRPMRHPIPTSSLPPPPPSRRRRRFISFRPSFRRRDTKADITDVEQGAEVMSPIDEEGDEWDRIWERGEYPFVRLPENRATCVICLSEFEAPRRVSERERAAQPPAAMLPEGSTFEMQPLASPTSDLDVEEVRVESPRDADARTIELADSGGSDAPQPLRLLSCGHVYHKECVDPWLTQKSGRCPYCSARVEVPPAPERKSSIWRRGTV